MECIVNKRRENNEKMKWLNKLEIEKLVPYEAIDYCEANCEWFQIKYIYKLLKRGVYPSLCEPLLKIKEEDKALKYARKTYRNFKLKNNMIGLVEGVYMKFNKIKEPVNVIHKYE